MTDVTAGQGSGQARAFRLPTLAEAMAELELGGIANAPPGTASVPPAAESRTTPTSDE